MKIKPRRAVRYYYLQFIRLRGQPHFLARGIAIGTFVGITPTIPFHTIMALLLAFVLRGSKVAALLSTVIVSNPVTLVPQYYLSWQIGNWLTPKKHSWEEVSRLMDSLADGAAYGATFTALGEIGLDSFIILLGGGIVLALPFTIAFYFLSHRLFRSIQLKRLEKKVLL
jgi:uncharacterized protein (DUF2062 family)